MFLSVKLLLLVPSTETDHYRCVSACRSQCLSVCMSVCIFMMYVCVYVCTSVRVYAS